MKLNKRGWGYFQMAWMSGIILFFFLLTIILIVRFYNSMDLELKKSSASVEAKTRDKMVDDLERAANAYMEHNYEGIRDVNEIRLTSNKLFKAGLFAKDLYGSCTGYAIASKTNGIVRSKGYIKCGSYKSPGFDNY